MARFGVLDTETTWENAVMSIGLVIAEESSFAPVDVRYFVLDPEYRAGGMFSGVLFLPGLQPAIVSRQEAVDAIRTCLCRHGVTKLFAYNAGFDRGHLPELADYDWFDIMARAIYRQHNPSIPADADCYATGRLKRSCGVEPILQLLSGDCTYRETHNGVLDAIDELKIMRLLGSPPEAYTKMR